MLDLIMLIRTAWGLKFSFSLKIGCLNEKYLKIKKFTYFDENWVSYSLGSVYYVSTSIILYSAMLPQQRLQCWEKWFLAMQNFGIVTCYLCPDSYRKLSFVKLNRKEKKTESIQNFETSKNHVLKERNSGTTSENVNWKFKKKYKFINFFKNHINCCVNYVSCAR